MIRFPMPARAPRLAISVSGNSPSIADGFYRHTDNYDTPLGQQANSFFRGDGLSLGSSYFFGDNSRVGAAVVHYDAKYGRAQRRHLHQHAPDEESAGIVTRDSGR
jgi:hypothetical protein